MNLVRASQISSPLDFLRGQLKHSWLENQVLNKSADDVIALRAAGWPALEMEFQDRIEEAKALSQKLEAEYSPAKLVDELSPFRRLSSEEREAIKRAVHAMYADRIRTSLLEAQLARAAENIRIALSDVLVEWRRPRDGFSPQSLQFAWNHMLLCARELAAALDKLPQGIVLP